MKLVAKRFIAGGAIIAIAAAAIGHWIFWHTSAPFAVGGWIAQQAGVEIDGLTGQLTDGFQFSRYRDQSESRRIEISGFDLRYLSPGEFLLNHVRATGVFEIQHLKIVSASFEEFRLERPTRIETEKAVLEIKSALHKLKLGDGPLLELRVKELEIGKVRYRTSLLAPELEAGPIGIRNLSLTRQGTEVETIEIRARIPEIQYRRTSGSEARLDFTIPAAFFADSTAPVPFTF